MLHNRLLLLIFLSLKHLSEPLILVFSTPQLLFHISRGQYTLILLDEGLRPLLNLHADDLLHGCLHLLLVKVRVSTVLQDIIFALKLIIVILLIFKLTLLLVDNPLKLIDLC